MRPIHSSIARKLARAGLLATLALAACNWGTRPGNLEPATGPSGVRIAYRLSGDELDRFAELFAVDSAGMLVLDRKLMHVAWSRVSAMDAYRLDGDYDLRKNEKMLPGKRAKLALVSRFPQGLTGTMLARVLAELKQDAVEAVK